MPQLILASQSASRKRLLTEAGYEFRVIPSDIEEVIDKTLSIPDAIQKLSQDKAEAVAGRSGIPEDGVIIAADSVVVFEGKIIGKPKNKDDLIKTLTRMSGRSHGFVTGFTIIDMKSRKMFAGISEATLWLKKLSPQFIREYATQDIPYTKAGGYGIHEHGKAIVAKYEGECSSIEGLPIAAVTKILDTLKVKKRQ